VFEQKETERHELKEKVEQLGKNLAVTIQAKESLAVELSDVKASFSNAQKDNQSQRTQLADLGLQVRVLTREVAIRDDPALAYEAFDPVDANHPEISDIDAVITNNLTAFKKLPHLLEQNKKLLRISRELGRKLEEKTSSHGADANDSDLESAAQAIESLTGTVAALRGQIANAKLQLDMAVKERDMFSRLLVQGRMMGLSSEIVDRIANGIKTSDPVQAQDDVVRSALKGIQQEFDKHRESFQSEIKQLQARTEEKTREVDVERERTASALASLRHEQNQNLALTQRMEQEKSDLNTHLHTITIREAEILNLRTEMRRLREEEDALTQQKSQLQSLLDGSNAQKEMLLANEQISVESANKLFQEKAELSRELASRRLLHEQELLVAQNAKREIEIAITSLREDLETARNNLADQRTAYQTLLTSQKSPEMKNRIEELESSLIAVKAERDEQVAKLESDVKAAQTDAQGKLNIGLKYQRRTKELLAQIADTKDQHTKAIADLQSQIDTLKAQSQTLENDVTAARQEAALKAKEVEDNSQEMAVTKRSLEEREAEIAKMAQAVPSETAQSGSAISEDAAKAMQSSLDLAKERISELEKELSAVRVAHDEAVNASQKPTATQTQAETVRAVNSDMEKDLVSLLFGQAWNTKLILYGFRWKGKPQGPTCPRPLINHKPSCRSTRHNLEINRNSDSICLQIDAEEEAKRLSIRIEVLEQEISHARAQLHAQTQTAAQTAPVSDEANVVDNKADTGGAETATPKIHVDNLQAEFDEYKTAQTKRYEEGVLKVNTTNVSSSAFKSITQSRLMFGPSNNRKSCSKKTSNGVKPKRTSRSCSRSTIYHRKMDHLISLYLSTRSLRYCVRKGIRLLLQHKRLPQKKLVWKRSLRPL
jgi:chromosome segregation ATPase